MSSTSLEMLFSNQYDIRKTRLLTIICISIH